MNERAGSPSDLWLGRLPSRWSVKRLGALGSLEKGRGGSKADNRDTGVPVVRYGDLYTKFDTIITASAAFVSEEDAMSYTPLPRNSIVFAASGESAEDIGKCALSLLAEPAVVGGDAIVLRVDSDVDPLFLTYALQSSVLRAHKTIRSTGFTVVHISVGKLKTVPIPLPLLDEQRVIAAFLDRETARIDRLIDEQQQLIKMLRERRAGVLFDTFDSGRDREATSVGRVLAARPFYGVLVPKYVEETEGVPFIRVGDLLNLNPARPMLAIAPEQSDEFARTKIVGGEVLLGVVGKMGQAAMAPAWLAGANVARAVAVLRCKDQSHAPLLCAWLGSDHFLHQADLATSGDSIQPTLGMKDLARFSFNLPTDPNAAVELARQLAKLDELIAETERFIELSRERRSALIAAAVTGQIDVWQVA